MSDTRSQTDPKPSSASAEDRPLPAPPAGKGSMEERPATDPTRYGDWEKNGRCIDF